MTPTNHDDINYKNNPLHSVGLKKMIVQLSDHYGFDILFAYLNINCFRNNPSVASSAKFLKKTDWAREKVEAFYLYTFKNLPKAARDQYHVPPRDRIIPEDQSPGEPAVLSLEEAALLKAERESKAAEFDSKPRSGSDNSSNNASRRSNSGAYASSNKRPSHSRNTSGNRTNTGRDIDNNNRTNTGRDIDNNKRTNTGRDIDNNKRANSGRDIDSNKWASSGRDSDSNKRASSGDKSSFKDKRKSLAANNRTASTPANPWGLPKE